MSYMVHTGRGSGNASFVDERRYAGTNQHSSSRSRCLKARLDRKEAKYSTYFQMDVSERRRPETIVFALDALPNWIYLVFVIDLYEKAKGGDRNAENDLFRLLFQKFRIFAINRLGSTLEADEVAQQACITVLAKYKAESFSVSFEAWAYGVFKMMLRSDWRKATARSARFDNIDDHQEIGKQYEEDPLLRDHLLDCLKALARKHRRYIRILNLRLQGYDTETICEKVGINMEQHYVYLGRARGLMKQCLIDKGVEL